MIRADSKQESVATCVKGIAVFAVDLGKDVDVWVLETGTECTSCRQS